MPNKTIDLFVNSCGDQKSSGSGSSDSEVKNEIELESREKSAVALRGFEQLKEMNLDTCTTRLTVFSHCCVVNFQPFPVFAIPEEIQH